ncbi:primosomal protein DnaI [Lactococcus paracarnosus]|uniref:Primosomal protein DnaI n=1 Tax=Pseudolactococcus paracarnosus TaxID=2749962 RepID=A0A7L4WHL0_9LACT|nr:primosomal protein DnaI [Lactococcus paracarnosus]SPC36278.1 Helicase loader DnaI [Lactococcus piscium]MCJ1984436.1 primosomal protein DnaI [Lactococcus paracarnosus]MCJ1994976.1 primosomal protein DnaI [Lactococcus paracarnosus]MCJ1998884.1 primosomal protein DnaI [Lactococcus paracarnosus]
MAFDSIADGMKTRLDWDKYHQLSEKILENQEIQDFISKNDFQPLQVNKSLSKFNEYVTEKAKFVSGEPTKIAGYEPILFNNEGFADVTYRATADTLAKEAELSKKRRVRLIGMPKDMVDISWDDVLLDDANRIKAYQAVATFISDYPNQAGIYLYGQFGVGKSFMMAAMANELAEKGISTTLIHYPSFISDNSGFDDLKAQANEVKKTEVLVLDDIGAESNNDWIRDNILQVILQYRMQENLPTFFTSNLTMLELEQRLAMTKKGDETWSAKRVMERVRKLSTEYALAGENRRNG